MIEQLRADLLDLEAMVTESWASWKTSESSKGGSCLFINMNKVVGMNDDALARMFAMARAMGFPEPINEHGWSMAPIPQWNDEQKSREPVLARIRGAIEGLSE